MARAICKINMGLKNQTVYIQSQKYSNKQTLESYEVPFQNLANFFINQSDITEIHFGGSKTFAQKIENDIKKLELEKYSKNTIQFKYDF